MVTSLRRPDAPVTFNAYRRALLSASRRQHEAEAYDLLDELSGIVPKDLLPPE
jgi:hypothetical protein